MTDVIRDVVLPVVEVDPTGGSMEFSRSRGSAFLIGDEQTIVTAAHVLENPERPLAAMRVRDDQWVGCPIVEWEAHATEDIAVARIDGGPDQSFLHISPIHEHASCEWDLWGYPSNAAYDKHGPSASFNPNLVYVRGYIRRRLTDVDLPEIRGRFLYELSDIAGAGCSGAPVVVKREPFTKGGYQWDVIGIYLGERVSEEAGVAISYAARMCDLYAWEPQLLGRTLLRACHE